jgi:hypothetical protein
MALNKKAPIKKGTTLRLYCEQQQAYINNLEEELLESDTDRIEVSYGNDEFNCRVDEAPYCCAVLELGDITVSHTFPQVAFNKLMKVATKKWQDHKGATVNYGIMINTNGKDTHLEELLSKCPHFKLVKTFINPNSGNTIKMWVSK